MLAIPESRTLPLGPPGRPWVRRNQDVHNSIAALAAKPRMTIISAIVAQEIDNGARHGEVV
jgi:hypothetical protein